MDEITRLINGLRPGSPAPRRTVAALVAIGAPAVEPLITALEEAPWQVRRQAASALGQIGDIRAVPPLIRALGHGRLRVRQQAARALGRIRDPRAVEPLITTLRDRVAGVRQEAGAALVQIGAPAVLPLTGILKSRAGGRVRYEAAKALGEIALRDPVPELRAALPPLHRLMRSLWSGWEAKESYQTAIRRIEEGTNGLKDVPVPAMQPMSSAADLPVPAASPPPAPDSLPIPSNSAEPDAAVTAETVGPVPAWWRRLQRTFRRP